MLGCAVEKLYSAGKLIWRDQSKSLRMLENSMCLERLAEVARQRGRRPEHIVGQGKLPR